MSDLKLSDIDLSKRMIIPNKDSNRTKNTRITFFNEEAGKALREYLAFRGDQDLRLTADMRSINEVFTEAKKRTGIHITPQVLREWFCCEIARLGVQDRYVDAFCGRVTRSILARHFTDYSPKVQRDL